jgi:hypothetical protein
MYLWKIVTIVANEQTGGSNKTRYVIVSSNRAEDAYSRARLLDLSNNESLKGVDLLGSLPSVSESTAFVKTSIYIVKASYVFPTSPSGSSTRLVPSDLLNAIDTKIGERLGLDDKLGPIATDPSDPVDTSVISLLIGLSDDDVDQVSQVISSFVFRGLVPRENIIVLNMRRISEPLS